MTQNAGEQISNHSSGCLHEIRKNLKEYGPHPSLLPRRQNKTTLWIPEVFLLFNGIVETQNLLLEIPEGISANFRDDMGQGLKSREVDVTLDPKTQYKTKQN